MISFQQDNRYTQDILSDLLHVKIVALVQNPFSMCWLSALLQNNYGSLWRNWLVSSYPDFILSLGHMTSYKIGAVSRIIRRLYSVVCGHSRQREINAGRGEQGMQTCQTVLWARDTVFDLCQVVNVNSIPKHHMAPSLWSPPPDPWLKCNLDGAFYSNLVGCATGYSLDMKWHWFLQK